jgi:hypothetical protein
MPDKKITQLDALTSLTADDVFLVVDDPAGTPTSKKVTAANLATYTSTGLATLASPTFTGTVSGITKTMVGLGSVDNTADTAKPVSTAQQTALDLKSNLASPTFTGTPLSTTAAVDTNTTQVATTAYVVGQGYAKLASPTLTGTPLAPTATAGTSTTQIATTAFADPQGDQFVLSAAIFTS